MAKARLAIVIGLTVLFARSASADVTGFIGATTTPENRASRGVAVGAGVMIFSTEFEYAYTSGDLTVDAPTLKTGSANLLLQPPFPVWGFQPYVTGGFGLFTETLREHVVNGIAPNTGAGVKISLTGPIRLRVDYRMFKFGDGARYSKAHRIYAGLNLKF